MNSSNVAKVPSTKVTTTKVLPTTIIQKRTNGSSITVSGRVHSRMIYFVEVERHFCLWFFNYLKIMIKFPIRKSDSLVSCQDRAVYSLFLSSQKASRTSLLLGILLWTLFFDAKKSRPDKRVLGIPFSLERPGDQEHWLEHVEFCSEQKSRTVPNHWLKAPVHLDVGGKNYTTSLATLKSVPGTFQQKYPILKALFRIPNL